MGVLVHQIQRGRALIKTADIVFPHALVNEVVEVKVLKVLELGPRRRKQLFADFDVGVHGSTDVEEQQDLHRVVTLGHHLDVEQPRVSRSGPDGVVQIKLFGRAGARKLAEPPHGNFDIAGT